MLTHLRRNVVAYLALVIAMSTGTAYAAANIANGSVTTKKLAKNAVVSKKVKDGALIGADLRDGSVTGADLLSGSVGSREIGDQSLTGDDLGPGSVGSSEVTNGSLTAQDLAPGALTTIQVTPFGLSVPAAVPELPGIDSHQVSMGADGPLYVRWTQPAIGVTCTSGLGYVGLYLDGTPVPGTRTPLVPDTRPSFSEVVALVPLTAGSHTFRLAVDCPSGTHNASYQSGTSTWTTIRAGG